MHKKVYDYNIKTSTIQVLGHANLNIRPLGTQILKQQRATKEHHGSVSN